MWNGVITEELKEVAAEYARRHNGMYPDEFIEIHYDNMPYDYFLSKIKEALEKNCNFNDVID